MTGFWTSLVASFCGAGIPLLLLAGAMWQQARENRSQIERLWERKRGKAVCNERHNPDGNDESQ